MPPASSFQPSAGPASTMSPCSGYTSTNSIRVRPARFCTSSGSGFPCSMWWAISASSRASDTFRNLLSRATSPGTSPMARMRSSRSRPDSSRSTREIAPSASIATPPTPPPGPMIGVRPTTKGVNCTEPTWPCARAGEIWQRVSATHPSATSIAPQEFGREDRNMAPPPCTACPWLCRATHQPYHFERGVASIAVDRRNGNIRFRMTARSAASGAKNRAPTTGPKSDYNVTEPNDEADVPQVRRSRLGDQCGATDEAESKRVESLGGAGSDIWPGRMRRLERFCNRCRDDRSGAPAGADSRRRSQGRRTSRGDCSGRAAVAGAGVAASGCSQRNGRRRTAGDELDSRGRRHDRPAEGARRWQPPRVASRSVLARHIARPPRPTHGLRAASERRSHGARSAHSRHAPRREPRATPRRG